MGGPYAPTTASIGGLPTVSTDVPIDAVFMFLYICFAATNMTIFQKNKRRGHKFLPSGAMFGFCMARIATLTLRIVWAVFQHDVSVAIAANIFVNAGILIVYVINMILAQRILRALHPEIGWNRVLRIGYKVLYILIGAALAMVITSVVLSAYTLNPHTKQVCRDIQLSAITYLLVFTCLPAIHIAVALLVPTSPKAENFGEGSMKSKILIVTASACLCMLIAGFKAGMLWMPPRPIFNPAWYQSKACFYIFNFMLEIFLLTLLTLTRIDKRFFVPNGSKQAGDYTRLADDGHEKSPRRASWSLASEDTEKGEMQP